MDLNLDVANLPIDEMLAGIDDKTVQLNTCVEADGKHFPKIHFYIQNY